MVTQRPQSVNKEVLSQVECLCVLQVNGAHERKALEEWVQEAGADRKLVGELTGLASGEGYVWSPSWLRTFKRVQFSTKKTFDASATPEVGKAAKAASLSTVDVAALRADLQEVVAAAEKDDPKALRRRIAELERELAKKPAPASAKIERVEVSVLKDAQVAQLARVVERMGDVAEKLSGQVGALRELAGEIVSGVKSASAPAPAPPRPAALRPAERRPVAAAAAARPVGSADSAALVGNSGLRRMLVALAQRPQGLTNKQLGVRAGVSCRSGTFSTYLSKARSQGWLQGTAVLLRITEAGVTALGSYDPLPEGAALADYWIGELGGGAARMLQALVEAYPAPLTNDELGERAGISSRSGTFSTYLSRLRSLELVTGRGELRASEELA